MIKVRLGDVAREYQETCKGTKNGYPIVGLEHLVSEDINLTSWDEEIENTFTKMFRKGHVLFGRRRAYLKKAAVAPFDGICSGDITVIEAIPERILPELLPFIIQNDKLFDFAIGKSAGSLSPRVKWEDLQNYQFDLPEINAQKGLVDILWEANNTKEAYKKLLEKTDELIKSQFIEIFNVCSRCRLGDHITQIRGVSYKPADLSVELDTGYITLFRANNIYAGEIIYDDVQYVKEANVSKIKRLIAGDILICGSSGSLEHVGKAALYKGEGLYTFGAFCKVIRSIGILHPQYLASYFKTNEYRETIRSLACGTNINNLRNEYIDDLQIPMPSDTQQQKFVAFIEQLDKSNFELQQTLKKLNTIIKMLI